MKIQDFNGNFKFKLIVPISFILNWIAMVIGPILFPVKYQYYCVVVLLYASFKSVILFIGSIVAFCKAASILKKEENTEYLKLNGHQNQITYQICKMLHAFIIPSYKEDQQLLSQTLERIANQQGARHYYMVFLAMQAHQQGSDKKAQSLINKFKNQFLLIGYTRHEIRQFQQKGKASNVSWCVQNLQQKYFIPNKIQPQNVMLTIIDADTWVPHVYIQEVQSYLKDHWEQREFLIFQPSQIFTRNHLDVPFVTRTYDQIHGGMHHNNLFSFFNISFSLSNYSLSYNLVKNIGWWDTCADAIGQDFHTSQKAFWKTNGKVRAIPIYTPFNQLNVETGKGYIQDIKARFWQAQRHARGVSDVAYCINQLITTPFSLKNFNVAYQILQSFILPTIVPWVFLAINYQTNLLFRFYRRPPQFISEQIYSILFTLSGVVLYLSYFLYWVIKRWATTVYYHLQNQSIIRIFQYVPMFTINMFLITIPAYILASFGSLFQAKQYIVADKVTKKHFHQAITQNK